MSTAEHYDVLVIGSGEAGKYLAWTLSKDGHRTALVERKLVGGSCPNVACLPSKNVIHSAKVASYASRAAAFGLKVDGAETDMPGVQRRKKRMVDELVGVHLARYEGSGVDLIMGEARFVAPKAVTVALNEGGTRALSGERVILSVGTRAAIPDVPGLTDARAYDACRSARTRSRAGASRRGGRRVCRTGAGAGLSSVRLQRHRDRERRPARRA